jgi:hypothetical protein
MGSNRRVSQVFKINHQVSRLTGRPKTDGGTVYKTDIIKAKLKTGKNGPKNRAEWQNIRIGV